MYIMKPPDKDNLLHIGINQTLKQGLLYGSGVMLITKGGDVMTNSNCTCYTLQPGSMCEACQSNYTPKYNRTEPPRSAE